MSKEVKSSEDRKAAILKAIDLLRIAVEGDEVKEEVKEEVKKEAATTPEAQADSVAKEEKEVVKQSLTTDVEVKDQGDQNAKANANWKLTDAEREKVASQLLDIAHSLID